MSLADIDAYLADSTHTELDIDDDELERQLMEEAQEARLGSGTSVATLDRPTEPAARLRPHRGPGPVERILRPTDLPELVEPPGYYRDPAGRWRYRLDGALVPSARDITLDLLWRFARTRRPLPAVLVPEALTASPELDWARKVAIDRSEIRSGAFAASGPHRSALVVPLEQWRQRARWPLGIDAPELAVTRLLDVRALADLLAVGPSTVRAYVTRGHLPPPVAHLGGVPLWSRPVVDAAVARRPGAGRTRALPGRLS